jgi:hypothetical protein
MTLEDAAVQVVGMFARQNTLSPVLLGRKCANYGHARISGMKATRRDDAGAALHSRHQRARKTERHTLFRGCMREGFISGSALRRRAGTAWLHLSRLFGQLGKDRMAHRGVDTPRSRRANEGWTRPSSGTANGERPVL